MENGTQRITGLSLIVGGLFVAVLSWAMMWPGGVFALAYLGICVGTLTVCFADSVRIDDGPCRCDDCQDRQMMLDEQDDWYDAKQVEAELQEGGEDGLSGQSSARP